MRKMRRRALRAAVLGLVGVGVRAGAAGECGDMRAHRWQAAGRRCSPSRPATGRSRSQRRGCRDVRSRHEYGGELRRGDAREHRADHRDRKHLCGHADRRRVGAGSSWTRWPAGSGPSLRVSGPAADAISLRLGDDDNVVTGGSLGADLDGDATPDLIYNATERLIVTGGTGADDFEFGGDGADLGGAARLPGHAQRRRRRRHAARRRARRHVLGRRGRGRRHLRRPPLVRERQPERPGRRRRGRSRATSSAPTSRTSPAARATTT